MRSISIGTILLTATLSLGSLSAYACFGSSGQSCPRDCGKSDTCCSGMGGISYCDSSAGFYVCQNGHYSRCYCDRHAVMDFQDLQGCCLWQGGIGGMDTGGVVLCRNGQASEICSNRTEDFDYSSF